MYNRSQFDRTPKLETKRSVFDRSRRVVTTFNAGLVVPIECDEILPGDSVNTKVEGLVRLLTSKYPTMDRLILDMYAFWVPLRLSYSKTNEFFGENTKAPWALTKRPTMTKIEPPKDGWKVGTLADKLGYPVDEPAPNKPGVTGDFSFSLNRIKGYCIIWNEWFRNQNLQYPINILTDNETGYHGSNADYTSKTAYITTTCRGGNLAPACRLRDYLSSALPEPQKGGITEIGILKDLPVITKDERHNETMSTQGMLMNGPNGSTTGNYTLNVEQGAIIGETPAYSSSQEVGFVDYVNPANLYAKTDNKVFNIQDLRDAIMLQHLKEWEARNGTRYREILGGYGVEDIPEIMVQVPELLAAKRTTLNMQQVVQSSATQKTAEGDLQPLGETSGLSLTQSDDFLHFTKSFVEFGHTYIMAVVRVNHSYAQGVERDLLRKEYIDYYNPILANKSEQPVFEAEIFAKNSETPMKEKIFGYQEPWAEYRYSKNILTGFMRPNINQSLGLYWTYGDNYSQEPVLENEWIQEPIENIDRTLAVSNRVTEQFLADLWIERKHTRNMPVYGIPGLGAI